MVFLFFFFYINITLKNSLAALYNGTMRYIYICTQVIYKIVRYITICTYVTLTAVSVSLEVKPQLENVVVKLTPEPTLVRVLPFSIDNFECNVLVRRACVKSQDSEIFVVGAGGLKIKDRLLVDIKRFKLLTLEPQLCSEEKYIYLTRKYSGVVFLSMRSG